MVPDEKSGLAVFRVFRRMKHPASAARRAALPAGGLIAMERTDDFDIAGVTTASAAAWLRGDIYASRAADLDTSRCEVAFLNEIGNLASYRPACLAAVELWDRGARAAIAHVVSPVFLKKYLRAGGIVAGTEGIKWRGENLLAYRMVIPAAGWRQWIEKTRVRTADTK